MNVQKYWKGVLAALGDTTAAKNIDAFQRKVIVALGKASLTKSQVTALTTLDGSAGTADNTIIAVPAATAATTDTSAASLTSTNTALTAINNDIADLQTKLNAVITALKA